MARFDPDGLRATAQAIPEAGLKLDQLLSLAPGGQLPAMIVLCTLPAALPGLQLGWVCVPVLLYLSLALWRGQAHVELPGRLAAKSVSPKAARALVNAFAWGAPKFGTYCRLTWPALVRRTRRKPAAALVALMALVIFLPVPGGNFLPALSIVTLMAGVVWRDGRAIVAAGVIAVLSILLVIAFGWAAWAAATTLL